MGKNSLTLRGVLKLDTKSFERSVKSVRKSLGAFRASFASVASAIGASFALNGIIKQFSELTASMSSAKATLRNVSAGMEEYGQNLEWIRGIARQYNQNQVVLISNFAQLKAAADSAGMSLSDTQKIFESITRAGAAFALSTEQINNALMAVQQMISKGKVSSEELRRQLGNAIPGAVQTMAKALGVSVSEMEEMMKAGEILASDALPKFADALSNATGKIDVNTIEGLKNAITNLNVEIAEKFNFEEIYKKFLNAWRKILKTILTDGREIANAMIGVGAMFAGNAISKRAKNYFGPSRDEYKQIVNNELKAYKDAEEEYANGLKHFRNQLYEKTELSKSDIRLGNISPESNSTGGIKLTERAQAAVSANKELSRQYDDLNTKLGDLSKQYNSLTQKQQELAKHTTNFGWRATQAYSKVATAVKGVGQAIKGMLTSMAAGAFIALVGAMVTELIRLHKEAKRVKNLVTDWKKEQKELLKYTDETINSVENYRNILNQDKGRLDTEKERMVVIDKINKLLGLEGNDALSIDDSFKHINETIDKEIQKIRDANEELVTQQKLNESLARMRELDERKATLNARIANPQSNNALIASSQRELNKIKDEYDKLRIVVDSCVEALRRLANSVDDTADSIGSFSLPDWGKNSLGKGGVSFPTSTEDSGVSTPEATKATNKLAGAWLKYLTNNYDKSTKQSNKKTETDEFKEAREKFDEEMRKLNRQLKDGIINEKEYAEGVTKASSSAYNSVSGLKELDNILSKLGADATKWYNDIINAQKKAKIDDATKKIRQNAYQEAFDNVGQQAPKLKARDSLFDYKKTGSDKIQETFDNYSDYIDQLKEKLEDLWNKGTIDENGFHIDPQILEEIEKLDKELQNAVITANNLNQAMRLAEMKEDLKEYKKELRDNVYSTVKDAASALDNLVQGFRNLRETLQDTDTSGFEKMMAIINTIIQGLDSVFSVMKGIQEVSEVLGRIKGVQGALSTAIDNSGLLAQGTAMEALATIAADSSAKVALAEQLKQKAYEETAKAAAAASAMALPFPSNMAALTASIGAIESVLKAGKILKFSNGGYVPGHGNRDSVPALLTPGELVLNKQQQKGFGVGEVKFRIDGKDLVGVLNNINRSKKG